MLHAVIALPIARKMSILGDIIATFKDTFEVVTMREHPAAFKRSAAVEPRRMEVVL